MSTISSSGKSSSPIILIFIFNLFLFTLSFSVPATLPTQPPSNLPISTAAVNGGRADHMIAAHESQRRRHFRLRRGRQTGRTRQQCSDPPGRGRSAQQGPRKRPHGRRLVEELRLRHGLESRHDAHEGCGWSPGQAKSREILGWVQRCEWHVVHQRESSGLRRLEVGHLLLLRCVYVGRHSKTGSASQDGPVKTCSNICARSGLPENSSVSDLPADHRP